jgi:hypothetical protein
MTRCQYPSVHVKDRPRRYPHAHCSWVGAHSSGVTGGHKSRVPDRIDQPALESDGQAHAGVTLRHHRGLQDESRGEGEAFVTQEGFENPLLETP